MATYVIQPPCVERVLCAEQVVKVVRPQVVANEAENENPEVRLHQGGEKIRKVSNDCNVCQFMMELQAMNNTIVNTNQETRGRARTFTQKRCISGTPG